MTIIKICGLSEPGTLDVAINTGADLVGFVFFPPSPRHVVHAQAGALAARVPERIGTVGVFVDPDDALLDAAIAAAHLGAVQLHGSESPDRVADIRRRFGVETWKAVPVRTRADIAATAAYTHAADRLLFDAKPPKGADLPGGNGVRFDWRLLEGATIRAPWGLSGGLDAGTVATAI